MGLRMNGALVKLRLKVMIRDFKWILDRYGEYEFRDGRRFG